MVKVRLDSDRTNPAVLLGVHWWPKAHTNIDERTRRTQGPNQSLLAALVGRGLCQEFDPQALERVFISTRPGLRRQFCRLNLHFVGIICCQQDAAMLVPSGAHILLDSHQTIDGILEAEQGSNSIGTTPLDATKCIVLVHWRGDVTGTVLTAFILMCMGHLCRK